MRRHRKEGDVLRLWPRLQVRSRVQVSARRGLPARLQVRRLTGSASRRGCSLSRPGALS